MKPNIKTAFENDEVSETGTDWTADYALNHFALPPELAVSLSERRALLEQQAQARWQQQREARLAKKNEETEPQLAHPPLDWQQKFDPNLTSQPILKILSREDVEALYSEERDGSRSVDAMDAKRAEALCRRLAAAGEYRRLGQIPLDWESQLDALDEQFPNFTEVIQYLRAMFNLAMLAPPGSPKYRVAHIDPILIDGPPGIGKSYFCQTIAEMLGVPFRRHDFGSMQTNGELVGSDAMWANSKIGGVFKALTEHEFANPILLLDELDKTQDDQRYSPETALLALLEPSTSRRFHDLSIPDVAIDASHIYWIATSNDKSRIAAPLRSRFRTFDVGPIPIEYARRFVLKMLAEVAAEMRVDCVRVLRTNVMDRASMLSPRILRHVLREALAYAKLDARSSVRLDDLEKAIEGGDIPQKRRIGFLD